MSIKDLSLAKRLGFGFGAILLIIMTNTVISSIQFAKVKAAVHATEQEKLPYALLADSIAFDTLKVQQLLVQSAASFSTDGVREAEKTMAEIRSHLAKFRALAKGRNDAAAAKAIDDLEGAFSQFHEKGKKMVDVYVSQGGIDAAGQLLNEFDKSARMLSERVLALQKEYVEDAKSNINGVADTVSTVQNVMFVLTAIALLVGGLIAYLITVSITVPLNEAVSLANQIAEGDLRAADIQVSSSDETGKLGAALNKMKGALREVVAGLDNGAALIASSSSELSTTVQQMTSRAEDQAGKALQVATSSTQMSQQIAGVASNAAVMTSLAKEALVVATSGAGVVKETAAETHAMSDAVSDLSQLVSSLGERSKQIGNIVGVIKDVASQTNLLALNAAIEAARAGEQGRGFAVVADEVRKLAERTSSSTTEIDEMIRAIQDQMADAVVSMANSTVRVGNGVRLAMQAGDSLNRIVSTITNLQSTVEETASSTEEMANAANRISADIVDVASVSKETSSRAGTMEREAGKLAKLSDDLIFTVSKFRS